MDLATKIGLCLFAVWAGAMFVGLLVALAPLILYAVGFIVTMAILTLIGRLVSSWFGY